MSSKFQVTLPDALARDLKREAARREIPLARFIRETMQSRLARDGAAKPADPFAAITALVDAPETDLAARVDEELYR